jgi:photosystem II stability/assembly factor-like uncharacterized protein
MIVRACSPTATDALPPRLVVMASHRRILAAALFCLCALGLVPAASAQQVLPDHIRGSLFAACLISDDAGWVVGELGSVLRTDDGGATWTRQSTGIKKPFLAISCVDRETAWIGGKSGVLYHTTDGGAAWRPLASGTKKHIFDLEFRDRSRGLAVGDWGLLMYTEDGGQHWTRVGMPEHFELSPMAEDIGLEPADIILYAVSLADDTHGWTVGEFGTIMATEDGGRTWRQQTSPVETTLFGVHFANGREGWAVGIDAEILHTTDGGRTWREIEAPHQQRAYYDVIVSGSRGWIAGDAGTLLTSHDHGLTWAVEPLPIELAASWFRAVALRPSGRGIAAGAHGLLYRLDGDAARDLRGGRPRGATMERGPS